MPTFITYFDNIHSDRFGVSIKLDLKKIDKLSEIVLNTHKIIEIFHSQCFYKSRLLNLDLTKINKTFIT